MGRDSRSRSRRGDQYRRHHHSGRRSPSPRRRDSRGRAPNRRDHRVPQGEDVGQYPRTWQSTSSHYDTNKEYGLPFPRMIESTQWSRKHQIAGLPVDQIRVVDMVPKGIQNYGPRLVANGRYAAFQMFRTRLDPLIASTLSRNCTAKRIPLMFARFWVTSVLLMNEWTVKQEAVQAMCENPPAPKVLVRDLPDGTRKRLQVYLGGGIFRPKPPVFDRSWRSPSKNTVKNSTEDTCSWTRPSKIGKRKVKKKKNVFFNFLTSIFWFATSFFAVLQVAWPGGGFLSFWTRFRTDFRRFVIAETLVFTMFFCFLHAWRLASKLPKTS